MKTNKISETKKKNTQKWPKVSIIILNWNNYNDTKRCLISLKKITYPNYKVFVVDNGSNDGSGKKLKKEFPFYCFIFNKKNLGYAAGNNKGMKEVLNEGMDYILLLNNDTKIVNPYFLTKLVKYIERDKDVGVVGPKVINGQNELQKTILYFPFVKTLLRERFWPRKNDYTCPQTVESLLGVCFLIRCKVINEVGFFDENYFMYHEEIEWFYRVRKKGWIVEYLPVKSIIHYMMATSKKEHRKMLILQRVNPVYTLTKHKFVLQATIRAGVTILINTVRVVLFILKIYRSQEIYDLTYLEILIMEIIRKWRMGLYVNN